MQKQKSLTPSRPYTKLASLNRRKIKGPYYWSKNILNKNLINQQLHANPVSQQPSSACKGWWLVRHRSYVLQRRKKPATTYQKTKHRHKKAKKNFASKANPADVVSFPIKICKRCQVTFSYLPVSTNTLLHTKLK